MKVLKLVAHFLDSDFRNYFSYHLDIKILLNLTKSNKKIWT